MGCTYSSLSRGNDESIRSFRVHNVDDQGMELNRGVIEIKDNNLVLYQKGKEPIRWPLRCLRRYGFDAELFSFESGRRCAMGPGIYAFKCAHAGELFNLVQASIQKAGEEDQRGQQLSHNHPAPVSGLPHSNRQMVSALSDTPTLEREAFGTALEGGEEEVHNGSVARRNSSHLYVNGILVSEPGNDYVNANATRGSCGAFQIDETAALVDFLHNPPGIGTGSSNSQVHYAELCMPDCHLSQASMENLLDETGQGALHNVERTLYDHRNHLPQYGLSHGCHGAEHNRISLPNDILAGASQDSDSILQSTDSEVFLTDNAPEGLVCTNYVNIALEEGGAAAASSSVCQEILLPPSHEIVTNYANLTLHGQKATKAIKPVNYILIDHKNQNNDTGGAGNAGNNSPTSPTSYMSIPESPSRKTEGYAMIDFDRTVALSNTTRTTDDEGSRKTRHNSTINEIS